MLKEPRTQESRQRAGQRAAEKYHDIGQKLYELRYNRALTQEELASMASIHKVTISDIERGDRRASPKTTRRLAEALGVDVQDLNGTA